ncbi:hypothetical protein MKW98_027323 [Papaver atlanticum]|uniref:Peptidase A1 domain-containing protein n=1 Tax=Papaver atlanticum TaxID=357466 RepID=A0AAD4SRB8_9MAGN|nr:hypothetical protein MKW98_027323 [Papaver atlanticum]
MVKINKGTPRTDVKLVLDLGGKLPWLHCDYYSSSSYHPINCASAQCSLANKPAVSASELCNGTANNSCSIYTINPVTHSVRKGELVSDLVTITSNEDFQAKEFASPRRFAFGCATAGSMLSGLDKGAKGVAGLGRSSSLSLVPQFAVSCRFSRIFALELLENGGENPGGSKIYFGGGPYSYFNWVQNDFMVRVLTYTPLLINPKNRMPTELNITRVAPVAPFTACYNSSTMPRVLAFFHSYPPSVSFIFPKSVWNITLFDLVRVKDGVDCVGFVDGGSKPTTSIVIGARQISFLEFDIPRSRLGFMEPNLHEF